jgi:UDP-N-acetylmuramoylalanine--D-glutamate ligase
MNNHEQWRGKKIAVVGAGVEGLSSATYFSKHGAVVTVLDKRETLEDETDRALMNLNIQVVTGESYLHGLNGYDVIVRSPGIKPDLPELITAKAKGVRVTTQTQLFFELSPAPIIGVTGTKGKGTTASLIAGMLKAEGWDAHLGGNIGLPPFTFLDALQNTSWVVLELSSFQLQDLSLSPHIAVMLMVTSEHLDYHKDVYEYIDAKRNIVRFQKPEDYAVLNRDYPASHESDVFTEAKIFQVSREREAAGDGCFVRQGRLLVRRDGKEREITTMSEVLLPGRHNYENICAATMAATLAGVSVKSMQQVLHTFTGLEHRLELVSEVHGVKYYDDSFSTTPETAIAAIESFDNPEIIILGGSSKQSDFTELGQLLSTRVNIRAIIGIGTEWEQIKKTMHPGTNDVQIVEGLKSMREVVVKAAEIAQPGDVVLLTPACASFDMFKNYKERGEQFKTAVRSLGAN